MHRISLLLLVVNIFASCHHGEDLPANLPEEQREFTMTLNDFCKENQKVFSEKSKKENYSRFESWVNHFSDSTGFVHNWTGEIRDIRLYDAPAYKSTSIGFEIQLPLTENRNLSLYYKKLIPYGHEYQNLIFHQLRQMEERTTVNFDGVLKQDANGNLDFGGEFDIYDKEEYNLCEPHLEIAITSLKPRGETDSEALEKAKKLLVEELKTSETGLDNTALAVHQQAKEFSIKKEELLKELTPMELEELRYLALAFSEPKLEIR